MNEILKALAENDRNLEASPEVEMRLRAAFRKKYKRRIIWPYFAVAAAIVVALLIPRPTAQTMQITVRAPQVVVVPTPRAIPVVNEQPQEIVTAFYALMEDQPFDRGELLRVSVPASTMRSVGLPVSEEHLSDMVQADVVVGEEGLARAIRFVKLER